MAEAGYKQLISYKLAQIAFDLGWDFVPKYYPKKEGIEAVVNYLIDLLTRSGYLLDKQINAVEEKHQKEGGYREKLLRKRLEYRKSW